MVSTQHLAGAVLFVLGVVSLLISWTMSGQLKPLLGLATVVLMAVGTVLLGVERRTDEPTAS